MSASSVRSFPPDPVAFSLIRPPACLGEDSGVAVRDDVETHFLGGPESMEIGAAVLAADERRRLVLDLHDGTQQRLVVLLAWLSELAALIDQDPSRAKALVSRLEGQTEAAIHELRALVHGIQSPELADIGLARALRAIALSSPIPARVSTHRVGRYDPATEDAVYFACREAVQNTIKHAPDATAINITLIDHDEWLEFRVHDNGPGFSDVSDGSGLASLRHRIATAGGSLEVHAIPGNGTRVHGTIPLSSQG